LSELLHHELVDHSLFLSSLQFLLKDFGSLLLWSGLLFFSLKRTWDGETIYLLGFLRTEVDVVVFQVPLFEGSGVDLDDSSLGQRFGSNQLVVGRVVYRVDDLCFFGDLLASPGVVPYESRLRTQLNLQITSGL
jgi:hypothetical protein